MMSPSSSPASVCTRRVCRVDRPDRRLHESHPRLDELAVRVADGRGHRPPEHHVELREAEHEGVALVDERDLHRVAELGGQPRDELEAAEPSPQHEDAHRRTLTGRGDPDAAPDDQPVPTTHSGQASEGSFLATKS